MILNQVSIPNLIKTKAHELKNATTEFVIVIEIIHNTLFSKFGIQNSIKS